MTLRFCDGFDSYGSSSDLTKKWATPVGTGWTWGSTIGRFGGGGISAASSSTSGNIIQCKAGVLNAGTSVIGFYVNFGAANPASILPFVGVYTGASARTASLRLTTTGQISMYGTSGDALLFTTGASYTDGAWHWIEWRNFMSAGSAVSGLYIDNVLQTSNATGNQSGTADHIGFITMNGVTITVDDLILYDDTTGAPTSANYPLNARQITTIRPASDGTVAFGAVVGGSGTHASSLNETNPDGDTSYVQDSTFGNQDLLNMAALGYTPTTITAVMTNLYVENPSGGTSNIAGICKSSATTSAAPAIVTPLVYTTLQMPFPTDPNGSIAWTAANLNAAQFGFKNS
jgi:hypothetical protein